VVSFIKPSQEEVIVVGRITLDGEASSGSGKLNEASLHIESSRILTMGSGVRVSLKFMPNFKVRGGPKGQANVSVFPGAIVALKGSNRGGGWFSVSEVMTVRLTRQLIFRGDVSYTSSYLLSLLLHPPCRAG
jgi:DNA polymerase alpha subunit B